MSERGSKWRPRVTERERAKEKGRQAESPEERRARLRRIREEKRR